MARYTEILKKKPKNGGLGFGISLTAFATFDFVAYIKYGGNPLKNTGDRFEKLLNETFFNFGNPRVSFGEFYYLLRCGCIHQLYPKNFDIGADLKAESVITIDPDGTKVLQSYFLLSQTISGLKNFIDHLDPIEKAKEYQEYTDHLDKLIEIDKNQFDKHSQISPTVQTSLKAPLPPRSNAASVSVTSSPSKGNKITVTLSHTRNKK